MSNSTVSLTAAARVTPVDCSSVTDCLVLLLGEHGIIVTSQDIVRYRMPQALADGEFEGDDSIPKHFARDAWCPELFSMFESYFTKRFVPKHLETKAAVFSCFQTLNLANRAICRIDASLIQFTHLRNFDISCNNIHTLENLPPKLESVRAGGNPMRNIELHSIECQQLRNLELGHCSISEASIFIRPFLGSLVALDLSYNELCSLDSVLDDLSMAPNLRLLYLEGNPFCMLGHYRHSTARRLPHLGSLDGIDLTDKATRHGLESNFSHEFSRVHVSFHLSSIENLDHPLPADDRSLLISAEAKPPTNVEKYYRVSYEVMFRTPLEVECHCETLAGWSEVITSQKQWSFNFEPCTSWRDFLHLIGFRILVVQRLVEIKPPAKGASSDATENEHLSVVGLAHFNSADVVRHAKTSFELNMREVECATSIMLLPDANQWAFKDEWVLPLSAEEGAPDRLINTNATMRGKLSLNIISEED